MSWRANALAAIEARVESFDWRQLTESRRRVLEAFLVLAAAKGYASVTMRELGDAVGLRAPSLYKHFREGREQVVHEALRWHYHRFAVAVLDAVDATQDPQHFWDRLVDLHVRRQLAMPESDMFDLLVATDRVSAFLTPEAREEVDSFLRLYANLYESTARDLGHIDDVLQATALVMSVLDDVRDWGRHFAEQPDPLEAVVRTAVTTSHAILTAVTATTPTVLKPPCVLSTAAEG